VQAAIPVEGLCDRPAKKTANFYCTQPFLYSYNNGEKLKAKSQRGVAIFAKACLGASQPQQAAKK